MVELSVEEILIFVLLKWILMLFVFFFLLLLFFVVVVFGLRWKLFSGIFGGIKLLIGRLKVMIVVRCFGWLKVVCNVK